VVDWGEYELEREEGRGERVQAAIFDLDGTLVDNMSWHAQAFETFVGRHRLPAMDREMRERTDGKRNREIFPMLFGRALSAVEIEHLEEEKEGMYRKLSSGQLRPLAGLVRLLDRFEAHGVAVAVATSGPSKNVEHTLRELGLAHRFPLIARGDQVQHGKPAPDVFLHAASLVGAAPAACLAFEDAPLGVQAARRAGMRCVAVTSSYDAQVFAALQDPPQVIVPDFEAYLAGAGRWLNDPA
jgi:beta-phosphoglucomutase family hydrolase